MEIVRLNPANRIKVLTLAYEVIKRGGTLIYPTETAYGLGADFYSQSAYNKVLSIKGRPKDKALPLIVSDTKQAASLVNFSDLAWRLARKYWPGPLTLVLPAAIRETTLPAHQGYLAIRVSSNPIAHDLSAITSSPLISTSANIFGQPVCYRVPDFIKQIANRSLKPDLIIDVGDLPQVQTTTIVKVDNDKLEILRQGDIKIND